MLNEWVSVVESALFAQNFDERYRQQANSNISDYQFVIFNRTFNIAAQRINAKKIQN